MASLVAFLADHILSDSWQFFQQTETSHRLPHPFHWCHTVVIPYCLETVFNLLRIMTARAYQMLSIWLEVSNIFLTAYIVSLSGHCSWFKRLKFPLAIRYGTKWIKVYQQYRKLVWYKIIHHPEVLVRLHEKKAKFKALKKDSSKC